MFQKILVALDHSELGLQIFNQALNLAKSTAASLFLVNVLSSEDAESPELPHLGGYDFAPASLSSELSKSAFEIYYDQWQNFAEKRLEMLRSLAEQAKAAGVEAEFSQRQGNPGRIICELARELEIDLIVLGRRGRSGVQELLLGSVSNYVNHHAPCSVLTIQLQDQPAPAQDQSVAVAS
jgi:nucleotide-binding universal stress UspA family protein